MRFRTVSWLAWAVCAVTLLVLAFSMLLILLGSSTPLPQGATAWRDRAIYLMGLVGAPILGGLIASRLPRNPYGWVWLGFGLSLIVQQAAHTYAVYARVMEPGAPAVPPAIASVFGLGNQVAFGLAPFLLLLFPTGRLPSRRWRPLAWISALSGAMVGVLVFLFDNPDQDGGVVAITAVAASFVIMATFVLSAISLVVRYRGARGTERQQLKWFALAAALAAFVFLGGSMLGYERVLGETFWNLLNALANACLYSAVGIAILRYRLYDIDIIINRTLVYGPLTAMLVAVYVGGVVILEHAFRALTGSGQQLAIVASTLLIAALFNPLRRRVQDFIDHLFYRRKYDAAKTLEAFSAKLRDETDLNTLSSELLSTVRETVQPEHVSLWLRKPDRGRMR